MKQPHTNDLEKTQETPIPPNTANPGEKREILRALGLFGQIGTTMAACVLVGVLGGKYLDSLLGTAPWLLIVGAVIGAASAFKALYDLVIKEWL